MKYREDIDGLRAMAVLPVVLFHAGAKGFSGGFVGVDIFFVISGFLITGLIAAEIREDRFTIGKFYERRIRRIFPALFAMLAGTFIMGAALLLPQDMKSLNASMAAAALSISNFYLWFVSGYFAKAAELQPLLHTWSLAVEEQFYVFFPVFLLLAWRWKAGWRVLTWIVLIGSLLLSSYIVRHRPDAAFYLLPTRAWELLAGSVIALGALPAVQRKWLNEWLAFCGLSCILISVFFYDRSMRFPGESALLPCIGAALIIYCGSQGPQTAVGRLLSWRPLVFTGLISYSLYLWHWPLIVFASYRSVAPLSALESASVLTASAVMAVISWRFIERPFRHAARPSARTDPPPASRSWSAWPGVRNTVVLRGLAVACVTALIGAAGYALYCNDRAIVSMYGDRLSRYDHQSLQIESPRGCLANVQAAATRDCLLGDLSIEPTVALWGDSYTDALTESMSAALKEAHLSGERFVMHACPSIIGTVRNPSEDPIFSRICRQFNEDSFEHMLHDSKLKTVVLLNNYLWYLQTIHPRVLLLPAGPFSTDRQRQEMILQALKKTIERLETSGKQVIVIGAYPSGPSAGGMARSLRFSDRLPAAATVVRSDYDKKVEFVNASLQQLQKERIAFIDPARLFCPRTARGNCSVVQHDTPLLSDGAHLSEAGATDLSVMILASIAAGQPRP